MHPEGHQGAHCGEKPWKLGCGVVSERVQGGFFLLASQILAFPHLICTAERSVGWKWLRRGREGPKPDPVGDAGWKFQPSPTGVAAVGQ